MFEWYTHRSSSYTASGEDTINGEFYDSVRWGEEVNMNEIVWTPDGSNSYGSISWQLEAPGDWCDVDVYGYLYADIDETQEWWDADDDTKWTQVAHGNFDMDPLCDGTDVVPYEAVSLSHLLEIDYPQSEISSWNLSVQAYDYSDQILTGEVTGEVVVAPGDCSMGACLDLEQTFSVGNPIDYDSSNNVTINGTLLVEQRLKTPGTTQTHFT